MYIYGGQLQSNTSKIETLLKWNSGVFTVYPNYRISIFPEHDEFTVSGIIVESYSSDSECFASLVTYDAEGKQRYLLGKTNLGNGFKGLFTETFKISKSIVRVVMGFRQIDRSLESTIIYKELKVEYGIKRTPWCKTGSEILNEDMDMVTLPYSSAKSNMDAYWSRGVFGQGVKVAILDDGMASNKAVPIAGGHPCGTHKTYLSPNTDHAINCAGITLARNMKDGKPAGVAPMAELYAIRMYYKTYSDRVKTLIEAIDYCIREGIDIISMSIHISENSYNTKDPLNPSGRGTPKHLRIPLRDAFIRAYQNNLVVVVAAGNNNTGDRKDNIEFVEHLPKLPGAVTVANATIEDKMRLTSGVGKWVDVVGYGTYIRTTGPHDTYATTTGTSMSTPQVAGIIALYRNLYPGLDVAGLMEKVYENCVPIPNIPEIEQGRGFIQPPDEILNRLPILGNGSGGFRTWDNNTYSWKYSEAYHRESSKWVELEGVYNGK